MNPRSKRVRWRRLSGGLAAGLALASAVASAAETPSRPNIVLIVADDLGYGDVGVLWQNRRAAMGGSRAPAFATPHLDTLAREGLVLRHHLSAAPVCAPSRASLLSGRTQGHASVRDNQFDRELGETVTLGSVLRAGGYATAAIGKWGLQGGNGSPNPAPGRSVEAKRTEWETWTGYPTRRGFDYFYGYVRHRDGHFHYPKEDGREVWENDREVSADLDLCYTADLFTAQAKRWISTQRAQQPERPFFLYLAYDTPHAVLTNPSTPYPAGGGLHGGVQWTGRPGAMINTAHGIRDGWMHPEFANAVWDHDGDAATPAQPWPDVQRRHANAVRRLDEAVGDLMRLLDDLGIANDTLVVFTSDNGPAAESYLPADFRPDFFQGFGPFDGIKRDLLEGGVRVPALVRWPAAVPAGTISDRPSGQWDWLATLADLAGVTVPASSDGVSLRPTLTGRGAQATSTLYAEYFNSGVTPDYPAFAPAHRKQPRGQMQWLILDGYKGRRQQIASAADDFAVYDLNRDPRETENLGARPEFASLQQRMKARVLQVRRPDPAAPRPYDAAPVPPIAVAPPAVVGALSWTRHDGAWPWLPDLRLLPSAARGESAMISAAPVTPGSPGALAFSGLVRMAREDDYEFAVAGDGEAMVFVHDIRLVEAGVAREGRVRLAAGWHPVRIYYRTDGRSPSLELVVKDGQGQVVPLAAADISPFSAL